MSTRNSFKIITHHPSLLLLPTFTFFTFSKVKACSSGRGYLVRFSKKLTLVNIGVSIVGYVCWLVWFYYKFVVGGIYTFSDVSFRLIFSLSSFISSATLTGLFLFLDRFCCCACVPGEEISIYDPSTDKRMILVNGEIVEPPEEDVESGNSPFSSICGCCCASQEEKDEAFAPTVIIKHEVEIIQIAEDIIEEIIGDIVQ